MLVRHEHAAGSMAMAYAQLTGEPGICLVTAGPGCTNLLTAVTEAHVGCLPMIVLAGRGATANAQRGAAQEVATDQIFAPVTKWSLRVDRPELVPEAMRRAFAEARGGRPGPVLVDLPRDVLDGQIPTGDHVPVPAPARPPGRPGARRAGRRRACGGGAADHRGRRGLDRLRRQWAGARAGRAAGHSGAHQPGRSRDRA